MNLSNSVLITRIFINGVMLNLNFVIKYEKKKFKDMFELSKKFNIKSIQKSLNESCSCGWLEFSLFISKE